MIISINSSEQMLDFWKELAQKHKTILLEWELWSGKTTLIKWFASWLWINPDQVNSPTYTYIQTYDNKLLHIDMYNISHYQELLEKWIIDLIQEYDYIAIERPRFIDKLWIEDHIHISISKFWNTQRKLSITN